MRSGGSLGSLGISIVKVVEGSRAVPRGVCPGGLSFANKPIYVATPSKAWLQVLQDTPPERRDDLVWIGNGLPLAGMEHATFCVPHYAVLATGQTPVTSNASPPTYTYGKHAATVARLLKRMESKCRQCRGPRFEWRQDESCYGPRACGCSVRHHHKH